MAKEIEIVDGAQGEGGGQVFRTALALSVCLGKAVRVINIRSGRSKPGLLRQHLTCLRAAQAICDAEVVGADAGSTEVSFRPGAVKAGAYRFAIGSAGSTSLVFQTVLPALCKAKGESTVHLEGGTHNGHAPSFDFITRSFLPVLSSMGYQISGELERYGFYPAGGGAWCARISPPDALSRLALLETGEMVSQTAVAITSRIPSHVAERELNRVQRKCRWPETSLHRSEVRSAGPGNVLSLRIEQRHVSEVFDSFGERGVSAERVAGRAIAALNRYLDAQVPIGEHLADQLLLPMVLARGGSFKTLQPSQHFLTNVAVIRQLTGVNVAMEQVGDDAWMVTAGSI